MIKSVVTRENMKSHKIFGKTEFYEVNLHVADSL